MLGRMMTDAPIARTARADVLVTGSQGPWCASTCSLIRDGDAVIVVDPGLAPSQAAILDPLRALGISAGDVTDVVLSHHHPDHALNAALFPAARVHDHWAIYYFAGRWDDVEAEGRELAPSVRLLRTPGHSAPDAAVLHASRGRVLELAEVIVPGHGAPFRPTDATPR